MELAGAVLADLQIRVRARDALILEHEVALLVPTDEKPRTGRLHDAACQCTGADRQPHLAQ